MAEDLRRQHRDALLSRIAEFRSRFSDVDVNVAGIVFRCHRLVLSAASEYFDAMFSGNFNESSESEITLEGIEANVFEQVLHFLYTGDLDVNGLNIYGLICAAEYYQLPIVEEMCIAFLRKNWNAVSEVVLKMYSFAHAAGKEKLVCLLSSHIYKHFGYFSTTPEYSQLTFDSLMRVFCVAESNLPILQNVYLGGIYSWLTSQQGLNSAERKSYSEKLFKKIDYGKISDEYEKYDFIQRFRNIIISKLQDAGHVGDMSDDEVEKRPVLLHAYISKRFIGDFNEETLLPVSIFTLCRCGGTRTRREMPGERKWVFSGELEYSSDFMKNIVVDQHLYSLSYSRKSSYENGSGQAFRCGSSPLLYPYKSLKLPPVILDNFDLCGEKNDIYVSSRDVPLIPNRFSADSTFSEHDLKCGIFMYKQDVDRWFPLPSPKPRYYNTSMVCLENIVYLIGGSNSNKTAQAYDPRTNEWVSLPCTTGTYIDAECCIRKNKICISGGRVKPTQAELYDPILRSWQPYQEDDSRNIGTQNLMEAVKSMSQINGDDYEFNILNVVYF